MTKKKIQSEDTLVRHLSRLRKKGKVIVAVNGSFDLLHAGHVESIEEAKALGDVLVVCLNSDKSIRAYKGRGRPIVGEAARARMLAALEAVDFVVVFHDINPKRILARIRPEIYASGSDWGKNCIERPVVEKYGGRVVALKHRAGFSTSSIIKHIQKKSREPETRAIFIRGNCTPKKLLKYGKKFGLNLSKSLMITDRNKDVKTGREVNVKILS